MPSEVKPYIMMCPMCADTIEGVAYHPDNTCVLFECRGCGAQFQSTITRQEWLGNPKEAKCQTKASLDD